MATPLFQPWAGTYVVPDQDNEEELLRITEQDQLVTASMGGVLAEQASPEAFRQVLDIGCGTGGWMITTALHYPAMTLVGIDVNPYMLARAQEQAAASAVAGRVTFRVMDALRILDVTDQTFDLVNLRFASSFVRTWEWPELLKEIRRVLRPGGVVRLTDEEVIHQSTSPAVRQFCEGLLSALSRSGHLFSQESDGLTGHLASLLTQYGFQAVCTHPYELHYQAGTLEGQQYLQNGIHALRTLAPFIQKWGSLQENSQEIRRRALKEMAHPDFSATWRLLTVWGSKPVSNGSDMRW